MRRIVRRVLLLALLAAGVLVAIGFAGALRTPRVVRYTVALPDWPTGTPPIRIVAVSDLHEGYPDMPRGRLEQVIAQVNALHPDLILLLGDYHGAKWWLGPQDQLEQAWEPLAKLHARLGVYAVLGNHDEPTWSARVDARFGGPRLLVNRALRAGPVTVAGLDDFLEGEPTLVPARLPGPLIVVGHEPDLVWFAPDRPLLFLAGHTHGGQVRLPGMEAWALRRDPYQQAHPRGLYHEGRRTMIVTSGVGTSGPALRVRMPPEIIEVTVGPGTVSGAR